MGKCRETRRPIDCERRLRRNSTELPGWWRPRIALAAFWIYAIPVAVAQGGPPMLTDDAGTPGDGVWEINFAYLEERNQQERLRSFPHIDINYGLGDHVQLKYETGWVYTGPSNGESIRSGLDNSLLGLKWRFLDQERGGVDVSVYPQLEVENPTGSVERGIVDPGPNLFLPFEIGHSFGKVKVVGELGYQYLRTQTDEWVAGLLAAVDVSESLELMMEVHRVSDKLLNGGDVVLNAGLRAPLSSRFRLLASVGTGLTNGPETPSFLAYLGVQMILGEK
jgi:hypothetical protein